MDSKRNISIIPIKARKVFSAGFFVEVSYFANAPLINSGTIGNYGDFTIERKVVWLMQKRSYA